MQEVLQWLLIASRLCLGGLVQMLSVLPLQEPAMHLLEQTLGEYNKVKSLALFVCL